MIVTLTANPSTDTTIQLPGLLERGAVQRCESTTSQAAGKGVNVARVITDGGQLAVAVLPASPDDPFVYTLRESGLTYRAVPFDGLVRENITLAEPDGTTTKINAPGDTLAPQTLSSLASVLARESGGARWAVIAGSLPPGVDPAWYSELVRVLRETTQVRVAVDTSGPPLLATAAAGVLPNLIKPNGEELAELAGVDGDLENDVEAAIAAARTLVERGIDTVLATLGAKGALLVSTEGAWRATSPKVTPKSTVGAGDSTLSGFLLGDLDGLDAPARLRRAVAYGAAAVQLPGSTLPTPADINEAEVEVTRLG